MNPQPKVVSAVSATSITNGGTATGVIDTLGYDYACITVRASASNTTSNKPSVLKISESDDATNYTDVSGAVGGTDFTVPTQATNADNLVQFNMSLKGRKRYLKVTVSPVTTQTIDAIAHLHKGEQAPITAVKAGVGALVSL